MNLADGVAWPYLIDEAEDSLSPDLIEQLGREILARTASHGRLVAFLGAGMSMAYGRESWESLVHAAISEVRKLRGRTRPEETSSRITCTPELEAVFVTLEGHLQLSLDSKETPAAWLARIGIEGKHWPLILQLCARALDLGAAACPTEGATAMETSGDVMPAAARADGVPSVQELIGQMLGEEKAHDQAFRDAYKAFRDASSNRPDLLSELENEIKSAADFPIDGTQPARRHFLSLLRSAFSEKDWVMKPDPRSSADRAVSLHSNGDASALSLLHHEFAIHRFATTNYDKVIERSLQVAGLMPVRPLDSPAVETGDRPSAPTRQTFSVVDLTPESTGAAIAFAVDGRRRHAQVLHLHGQVDNPKQMIVSERDYQQRYLKRSARRDLLDITVRTLFGASPILFIGTSVAEDDVLRPLREFMSAAPRRGDRVAVALLPAKDKSAEVAMEKVRCLVRYGIYVIHYGYENAEHFDGKLPAREPWLKAFSDCVKRLRECTKAMAVGAPAVTADLTPPPAPKRMEGLSPSEREGQALNIALEIGLLRALVEHVSQPVADMSPEKAQFINALLGEITTSVTSAFVCARLMAEQQFRHQWAKQLVTPLARYEEGPRAKTIALRDEEIQLVHFGALRDVADAPLGKSYPDPRWAEFTASITARSSFRPQAAGRRFITMSMPRGAGKGSMFDALVDLKSDALQELLLALNPDGAKPRWRVGLFGLGFLFDVAAVAQAVTTTLSWGDAPAPARDIVEDLRMAMAKLAERWSADDPTRTLLVISNVGAMFDAEGETKNGQLLQLLRVIEHRDFRACKLDILMFCDEGHLPKRFRDSVSRQQKALDAFLQRRLTSPDAPTPTAAQGERRDGLPYWLQGGAIPVQHMNASRLREIGVMLEDPIAPWSVVHTPSDALPKNALQEFAALSGFGKADAGPVLDALKRLHESVGSHRFGLTLILALAEERQQCERDPGNMNLMVDFIDSVHCAMALHIHESMPDKAIQFVLDEWSALHQRRSKVMQSKAVLRAHERGQQPAPAPAPQLPQDKTAAHFWQLCVEVLWHLAVLSHPADLDVLKRCPDILNAASELTDPEAPGREGRTLEWIRLAAETCVQRCLAFRVAARGAYPGLDDSDHPKDRYVLHRLMQRHFLRMMGGRNVESMEWDQFAPSAYASQPDELPTLSDDGHAKIHRLIQALIDYGRWPPGPAVSSAAQDALRAAYFVVRSSYSVGVLSHIAMRQSPRHPVPAHGHMEEYRRLVRWITHRTCKQGQGPGVFQPGEIVWLYAECGVISLTQGKLEDADSALQLALVAARGIESHDAGPLHARLLLHSALVHLERGRTSSARQLLEPISRRLEDHAVPPLLATFYLGIIDHLGGEYHAALDRYNAALAGLRGLRRTRATAFVLKYKAEALFSWHADQRAQALELAQEAIAVAQRGGHEDVRFMATLSHIRMRTSDQRDWRLEDAYQQLELASSYAAAMGIPRISAQVHEVRAHVLLSQGETRLSAQEAAEAAQIAALYDMKLIKTEALLTLARVYRMRGEFAQAQQIIRNGMEIAHACEYGACLRAFQSLDSELSTAGFRA